MLKQGKPFFVVLAAWLLLTGGVTKANDVVLVEDGQPRGPIVVPAEPTEGETFAAEELQILIQKMSGATLPIVKAGEAGDGPAILVGNQPDNRAVIDKLNKEHGNTMDAFGVVGKGNRLSLVGRSDDSTIWAAWQWLETQGVRFLMPGEHGTFIPKSPTIQIKPIDLIDAPAMSYRGPSYWLETKQHGAADDYENPEHGVPAWRLFTLRMRLNHNVAYTAKDSYVVVGSGHSYTHYLPAEQYFDQHPEWYNLLNGQRQNTGIWQICFTNEQAADEFAKNMLKEVQRMLDLGCPINHMMMFVSPNDGRAWCECDNCRKLADRDGSATSMVTHFANLVANRVRKVHPGAIITFYAYDNYSTVPDHVRPGPGVMPEVVFWTAGNSFGANHAQPMFSDANDKYRSHFQKWAAMSDGVYSHTYYGHYNWFTPWPFTTQMVKDIRTMVKEPKFQGMYSETHLHWGTQGLTFWLHPRLMWNPDLDVDAAIADYCRAAYGPAGAQMEHYYATLQKQMDSLSYICGYAVEIPQLLNESVIEKCDRHIDAAERYLDQMDEGMRWRTNLAIQSWRNSAKFAQACNLYVNSSNPHDRERIVTLVDEVDEFAQSQLGRWAFEYRIVKPQLDTISQNLRVNLHNLPAGTHVFNDSFNMGGAIKFFAAMKGWQMGMWGYSLPVNGTGEIELPLQAEARHRITSARVRWQIANPERVSGTLSVVSDDGNERILMKDVQQMTQGVDVPAEALGGLIRLRLRLLSQYHDPSIVLTGCNIEVQVE